MTAMHPIETGMRDMLYSIYMLCTAIVFKTYFKDYPNKHINWANEKI